mmetsp:Transcript_40231/g.129250  ORF Transcript_40231/g.129250 Transcript_40231/m.129250 type:complete len:99 (+) Transcript_40231:439-735(+)
MGINANIRKMCSLRPSKKTSPEWALRDLLCTLAAQIGSGQALTAGRHAEPWGGPFQLQARYTIEELMGWLRRDACKEKANPCDRFLRPPDGSDGLLQS